MGSYGHITELTIVEPLPASLRGCFIDSPIQGHIVEANALDIHGWVLSNGSPAVAVEISDDSDGSVIKRVAVDWVRPDVAKAFPSISGAEMSGFRATVGFVGASSQLSFRVSAVLKNQQRVPLALIRAARTWRGGASGLPLISTVIPCFNQAHYLSKAIESVLAQTYPHMELIVVDDGSKDNTQAVARSYPGTRYLYQPNQGPAASRNAGIRSTSGDFLVFLDADDRLLPDAFQEGLECFSHHPECGIVFGLWKPIGVDGSPVADAETPKLNNFYLELLQGCFIHIGATMFRRQLFEGGIVFDPSLRAAEDWDLYLSAAREGSIHCHGQIVYEYRRHGGNATRKPARILRAEIRVLRRHRRHACRLPGGRAAYISGIKRSRSYHGPLLAEAVRSSIQSRNWKEASLGGLSLLRHYPRGLLPRGLRRRQ